MTFSTEINKERKILFEKFDNTFWEAVIVYYDFFSTHFDNPSSNEWIDPIINRAQQTKEKKIKFIETVLLLTKSVGIGNTPQVQLLIKEFADFEEEIFKNSSN